MSRLWAKRDASLGALIAASRPYTRRSGSVYVTSDTALQHSAVWACLRTRANLVSSCPVDRYRRINGVQVEQDRGDFLTRPGALFVGGKPVTAREWLYATQVDLDRFGNCFGLRDHDALGRTVRVDLLPAEAVVVSVQQGQVVYRVNGKVVDELNIWHERQYVVPGLPVGLSPVAYAALAIGQYLSAQQFGLDWFSGGAIPNSRLKNTKKTIDSKEATTVKERWLSSVRAGEPVVLGADWDFEMISAVANQAEFLATQQWSIADVSRWFDCPADIIEAAVQSGNITYATITQRNLQLLIINIGPAIGRREDALTDAIPGGDYVKLNTDALLRMDPKTRYEMLEIGVRNRAVTISEWRGLDNKAPLTPADKAEFAELFPVRTEPAPQQKSEPMVFNVHGSPVDVDARSYPTNTIPERQTVLNVDATVAKGAVSVTNEVDAHSETTVPEREMNIHVDGPVIPPARSVRRNVETDETGRITAIVEEEV